MSEKAVTLSIAITPSLRAHFQRLAAADGRSTSNFIVHHLTQRFPPRKSAVKRPTTPPQTP